MKDRLLKLIFFFIIFFALIHILSLYFYFYWNFWWLDIVMHFSGGFWDVLFFLWLLFFPFAFLSKEKANLLFILIISIIFNLAISLAWEIFEVKFGITFVSKKYYLGDTIADFFAALSGGLLAALYFYRQISTPTLKFDVK